MHSFRSVYKFICFGCIQRRLWLWRNNSCLANSLGPDVPRDYRVSHCMAVGVGWGDPVHRIGIVLSYVKRRRELDNFRAAASYRWSFPVQQDLQGTDENRLGPPEKAVHLTRGMCRKFWRIRQRVTMLAMVSLSPTPGK